MTALNDDRGEFKSVGPQPRRRRRRGNARRPCMNIEQRAALAARLVLEKGWTIKAASAVFCVCPSYLQIACKLSDDGRVRLGLGELRLARLWRNYRERLAEVLAHKIDRFISRYGADRVMAALDRATAPQRVAAE